MRKLIKEILIRLLKPIIYEVNRRDPNIVRLNHGYNDIQNFLSSRESIIDSMISKRAKLYPPYRISSTKIEDYSYIAENSRISKTEIGKFCSIGPNFLCGYGIHPTNGISTAPMFYSTLKQNGYTLASENKIEERKRIFIGNDVFIGMNVTVLDGITIGDGAVIGAGSIVSKDIPSYAIAFGNPIKIHRYRFNSKQMEKFLRIKWWDFNEVQLKDVEKEFFNVDKFLDKYSQL